MIKQLPPRSAGLNRVLVAVPMTVALMLPASAAHPAPTQGARRAIDGALSMNVDPDTSDVRVLGALVTGKLQTRLICADFRRIQFLILNPPTGRPKYLPSPAYGERDKTYSHSIPVPRQSGVYRYQAVAPRTRVARGLKRATCAKLTSPVRVVVVPEITD